MQKICTFIANYMAFIILGVAVLALAVPESALWIRLSWINPLLMAVMFGMGLTLHPADFILIFKRPKEILFGVAAQFIIMPLLALLLGRLFQLETELLVGVVLVGTCPGGTASNVITYLAKGDVALSVGMTGVNTLLAPLLTPTITYLLLQKSVTVDVGTMVLSILTVVIVPIGLGFLINHFRRDLTLRLTAVLPAFSVLAIATIVSAIIAHNADRILQTGLLLFLVVILHNGFGFAAGYLLARLLRLSPAKQRAFAIEVGMQNSGLATSLAKTAFPDLAMATVPGAIFSVWHNLSGGLLAALFRRGDPNPQSTQADLRR